MAICRRATPVDVRPALDLALRVFMEYEAPEHEPIGAVHFRNDRVGNQHYIDSLISGENSMFVALSDDRIVGMVAERDGHIALLYVDGAFHRRGIATALVRDIVCVLKLKGYSEILLDASPRGLPFCQRFGFHQIGEARNERGCLVTPMAYEPSEIWDVLDEHGNRTGRYAERGRKMATGDYFLIVHVWKRNARGEWLIDQRTPRYGNEDLDGRWETTGGCAVAGEDSLSAALRETREELGMQLDPGRGMLFKRTPRLGDNGHTWFEDVWVFDCDEPIEAVAYDGSEVCNAMWATTDRIREMMATGEFVKASLYPYFDEMVEKCGTAK